MSEPNGVTILGTAGNLDHKLENSSVAELLRFAGANTGNLIFQHAVTKLIAGNKKYVGTATLPYSDPNAFKDSKYLIFPGANHLRPGADWTNLAKFIRSRRIPLVMLGLGAQAPSGYDEHAINDIVADAQVQDLAGAIREKSVLVSVRGEFSRRVCERLDIDAYVFGCPSLLLNPDPDLGAQLANKLSLLAQNPDHIQVALTAAAPYEIMNDEQRRRLEETFFRWTIERNGLYVQQSGGDEIATLSTGEVTKNTLHTAKSVKSIIYPHGSKSRFLEHVKSRHRIFWSATKWIEELRSVDLTFGSRLHGNMAALAAGVPGIFVAHDSRTDELIETMKLPHVAADKVPENIEQIFSLVEFDAQTFDDNRQNIRKQFGAALAKIGLQIEAVPNHISSPV
jgi:hypothetical protein